MPQFANFTEVLETLKNAHDRKVSCCLLIGAGCSRSAGIPLASEFVNLIKEEYPHAYANAEPANYPNCMAALSMGERRHLIRRYVEEASVNQTHWGVAQLIKHGYVDRVLTTNFDTLVSRACQLANTRIAVYDFAASRLFDPGDESRRAVFHLHGTYTGFRLLNTAAECNSLRQIVAPLFDDSGRRRIWIVIGYSGEQDPVLEQLLRVRRFDERLYWIGYRDSKPSTTLRTQLLGEEKHAFYVNGYDADSFFADLVSGLNIPPLEIHYRPFTYLRDLYKSMESVISSNRVAFEATRRIIDKAIDTYETPSNRALVRAESQLMLREYDTLIKEVLGDRKPQSLDDELRELVAWAHVMKATGLIDPESLDEVDAAFKTALKIMPDMHQALTNWGLVYYKAAASRDPSITAAQKRGYLNTAIGKFKEAQKSSPQNYRPRYNWGLCLIKLADLERGKKKTLLQQAGRKFEEVLEQEPNLSKALNNLGLTKIMLSKAERGKAKKAKLLQEARTILLRGEAYRSGTCAYNLACLAGLEQNSDDCRHWLQVGRAENTLPSVAHLQSDTDLDGVRGEEWFADFVAQDR